MKKALIKQKIMAAVMIALTLPVAVLDRDITCTVFMCIVGIPLMFSKKVWVM